MTSATAHFPITGTLRNSCNNPTNVLCPADMDPVAVNVMKMIPKADPVTRLSPTQSAPAPVSVFQGLVRVDYNRFNHHSLQGTFFDSRGSDINPSNGGNQVFGYSGLFDDVNQVNGILGDTWIVSNTFVNTVRAFYTSNHAVLQNEYTNHFLSDLGSLAPEGGPVYAPPRWTLGTGVIQIGFANAGPSYADQISYGIVNVATLTFGRHSIKLGGSYIWNRDSAG